MAKQRPQIAIWMYRDSGGNLIFSRLKKRLKNAGIEVFGEFDMRRCYCRNGRVYSEEGVDLSAIRVLYHMNADEQTEYQRYILHALERSGVTLVNSFIAFDMASDKFAANQRLRWKGLSVPESMLIPHSPPHRLLEEMFAEWVSVVVKPRYSFGGKGIIRFDDAEHFSDFIGATKNFISDHYVERFIPFKDHDYRIEIIGGEVVGSYSRGLAHSFKTNMSACKDKSSARFLGLPPKPEHELMALKAAKALGLDCTIVDMVEATTNQTPHIIEINCQLGIFVEEANRVLGIPAYGDDPYRYASDERKLDALTEFLIKKVKKAYANF